MNENDYKRLIKAQQGELDAVLMYHALANKTKSPRAQKQFTSIAKDEGRHASILKKYTKKTLKPKKTKAHVVSLLYTLLGHEKVCELLAKGEKDSLKDYEPLLESYPNIQVIMNDEIRHSKMAKSLI